MCSFGNVKLVEEKEQALIYYNDIIVYKVVFVNDFQRKFSINILKMFVRNVIVNINGFICLM